MAEDGGLCHGESAVAEAQKDRPSRVMDIRSFSSDFDALNFVTLFRPRSALVGLLHEANTVGLFPELFCLAGLAALFANCLFPLPKHLHSGISPMR